MYAKSSALAKAHSLLEELPVREPFSWTALIDGLVQQGRSHDAVKCFERMQDEGLSPDSVTYICTLKACGRIAGLDKGTQIHDEIDKQGLLANNVMLGTALVDMYVKCGALAKAKQVLDNLPSRDIVSWSALIAGYAQRGHGEEALNCFERMQEEGLSPNAITFSCILKACGSIGATDKGEQVHDAIARQGLLENNVILGNALVDMYSKFGALAKARKVLRELPCRNVVSWSTVIGGYAQQGQGGEALECFKQMQLDGVSPNAVTFICVLQACGSSRAIDKGKEVHEEIARQGLLGKDVVLGTALIDMYAKCGALVQAHEVFDELPKRNIVSWNALVAGYAQEGQGQEALKCFKQMQEDGLSADPVTFICILKACGSIGAVDKGEQLHDEITRQGLLGNNIVLGNALLDMYAKCGALAKARRVLEELPGGDIVSWNALITGFARRGHGEEALECFEQMQEKGLGPDAATFSSVLSACSHSSLVDVGKLIFERMSTKFGIKPALEHYTCVVVLLGHTGQLDKAVALIQRMPDSNHLAIWSALLVACRKWGDINIGRWAFEHALQVDKSDATPYMYMANIYAAAGMQEDAESIEVLRLKNKAWKKPGCQSLRFRGFSYLFAYTKHAQRFT